MSESKVILIKVKSNVFFFFKQKTAYEIYQCDWSSDVCSSDLMVVLRSEAVFAKTCCEVRGGHLADFARGNESRADRKSVV